MKPIYLKSISRVLALRPIVVFLIIVTGSAIAATAQSTTLTTTLDVVDGNTGSIALLNANPGGAGISLREAVIACNNEPVGATITINIPAGTYTLSIVGNAEDLSATGDLDINSTAAAGTKTISLVGAGSATTTINTASGWNDRILDLEHTNNAGDITVNISGLTFSGGNVAAGVTSGGAILAGFPNDVTNINNCAFTGNTAPNNGGAISQSANSIHNLTITNSTFINNTATTGGGGAVSYTGLGNASISGSTFSGNTAGSQGGAINIGGGAGANSVNILRNNIVNNTANGTQFGGAAVAVISAVTVNINFNRLVGNTSPNLNNTLSPNFGDGRVITAAGGTIVTFNVDSNWWGVNTGPVTTAGTRSIFGATVNNWLQLRHSASPSTINFGGTSTLTADIFGLNTGGSTAAGNLTGLPAFPSPAATIFSSPVNGTLSAASTQFTNGQATATFTANAVGAGSANATADSQTATAAITVIQATTSAGVTSSVNPAFNQQSITFTATVGVVLGAGTPTGGTVAFRDNNVDILGCSARPLTAGQATCVVTLASGTHPITVVYNGSTNFAASPASSPPLQQVVTVLTAAEVSLSGRILMLGGRGITNARVSISGNSLGQPRVLITGRDGAYRFDGLQAGETYIVTVGSRRFTFTNPSRVISLTDNVTDADFFAEQ